MDKAKWSKFVIDTASRWEDIEGVVRSTGIERIDQDHRRLLEYLLDMGEPAVMGADRLSTSAIIEHQKLVFQRFLNTLKRHYQAEEYFLNQYDLPGKDEQHSQHNSFMAESENIIGRFNSGVLSFFRTLKTEVMVELVKHINTLDARSFSLDNFQSALLGARSWDDVTEIVKSTGVPFVDDEHRKLTELMIKLSVYLTDGGYRIDTDGQKETVLRMTEAILDFTKKHFAHEIVFLKRYELEFDNQEALHATFTGEIDRILAEMRRGDFPDMKGVVEYLFSWWVGHINGRDYVDFHFSRIADPIFKKAETSDDFTWLIRKTGIDQIDTEHSQMINMLMQIYARQNRNSKSFDPQKALGGLLDFVNRHFSHEEDIMQGMNVKELEIHREAHRRISGNIGDGLTHAALGKSLFSPLQCKRLMNWWVAHTNGMDYETFVLNRN
ncbi:MAG: hypothetical protein H0S80_08275 [Desulfovibrionaceae bacterium]|nr:hypothetical protein [Desulfovibrionaceae bacterium]